VCLEGVTIFYSIDQRGKEQKKLMNNILTFSPPKSPRLQFFFLQINAFFLVRKCVSLVVLLFFFRAEEKKTIKTTKQK
jgi:hypothetical protein